TVRLTQSRQQHPAAEGVSLGTTEGLQAKTLRLLLEVELLQHQAP
ncbi:Os07g0217800, partial [Oryza sativa Japonica Group]